MGRPSDNFGNISFCTLYCEMISIVHQLGREASIQRKLIHSLTPQWEFFQKPWNQHPQFGFQPRLQLIHLIFIDMNWPKTLIYDRKTYQTTSQSRKSLKLRHTFRLKSRKPFHKTLKTNFDIQKAWKTHRLEHQPTKRNLVTDPIKSLPRFFTTSRKQWTIVNRTKPRHARTTVNLRHWGLLNFPMCSKCNKLSQDLDHLNKDWSLTKLTGGLKSADECDMNFKNWTETADIKTKVMMMIAHPSHIILLCVYQQVENFTRKWKPNAENWMIRRKYVVWFWPK